MLARAEVRCYILTLVQYYANTTDSYIHSVKTEPYVKEILNNLQYYPPETHPLSPAIELMFRTDFIVKSVFAIAI